MKKLYITLIIILAISFISFKVLAASVTYALNGLGRWVDTYEYLSNTKPNIQMSTYILSSDDADIGMSLSKQTWIGYSYISRCTKSVRTPSVTHYCTWKHQGSKMYKGTIVVSSVGSNFSGNLSGTFSIYNSNN